VLIIGGVLIVAVVGGSAYVAARYTRDLLAAQEEVRALNVSLEERVNERTVELSRANEEVQRFAYIVSHDLRSPLVNIMGFTSELEAGMQVIERYLSAANDDEDPALKEARQALETDMPEAIGFIRSSTGRMDNLINAILRLSREGRRRLEPQRIDMAQLLDAATDTVVHRLAEQGGEIRVEPPVPDLTSDRLAMEQIFGNLIDNAVKYLDPDRPGRIVVRGRTIPYGVQFEVEDNGRGIGPADRERIFELFRRAGAQDQAGEGIGLTHVRALARRLGGEITLESELGKGTVFRLTLPRNLPLLRETA
jgi:signal transduction histidine kinase